MKVERLTIAAICLAAAITTTSTRAQAPGGPGAPVSGGSVPADDITPTPQSPWGWLKMPKVTLPKIEMPKMPADPLAPLKTSARKVGDGTKKAWEGTKELFNGGSRDAQQTQVASKGAAPSMWQRMFGVKEDPKPEGPQTVAEWMSQPRVE